MSGFVYVVESGSGLFKVGFTNDPRRRLTMLRTSTPERLTLLGVVPGTMEHEKELHRLLKPWRVAREWFRHSRALQHLIDALQPLGKEGRDWKVPDDAHPLKAWRLDRHLTLEKAAALLGASKGEWCRWETGPRRISAKRALELAKITKIPLHDLRPDLWTPEVAAE